MQKLISRAIAAVLMGALLGAYVQHDYQRWNTRGMDAFLLHQKARFENYMNPVQSPLLTYIAAILMSIGALVVYEGLVALISAFLKTDTGEPIKT